MGWLVRFCGQGRDGFPGITVTGNGYTSGPLVTNASSPSFVGLFEHKGVIGTLLCARTDVLVVVARDIINYA